MGWYSAEFPKVPFWNMCCKFTDAGCSHMQQRLKYTVVAQLKNIGTVFTAILSELTVTYTWDIKAWDISLPFFIVSLMWFREHLFNILHILPFPPPPELGVTFSSPNHELVEWITHSASAGKSCFLKATTELWAPRLSYNMQAGITSTLKFSSCKISPPCKILLVIARIK